MKTALELVKKVGSLGGTITTNGENVQISAPKNAITPQLKREIADHKAEILQLQLWDTEHIRIPRSDGEGIDVWMVVNRLDKPGCWSTWFLRTEQKEGKRK